MLFARIKCHIFEEIKKLMSDEKVQLEKIYHGKNT